MLQKNRLLFLFVCVCCLLGLLLASCGQSNPIADPATEAPTTAETLATEPVTSGEHTFGPLWDAVDPTFFQEGSVAHYECSDCGKFFDAEGNELSSVAVPKLSGDLALFLNGEQVGVFTLLSHDESHFEWALENVTLKKDDVVSLSVLNDPASSDPRPVAFFGAGDGNLTEENKIHNDAVANLSANATPNGLFLSVGGYRYEGLVVQINDVQYPMDAATYYDNETKTNIFGWIELSVGDVVAVINNVTNERYGFDDLDPVSAWDTADFHRGEDGSIVIDYATRYGVEFDRAGDKKIQLTKTFAPDEGSAFEVVFASERPAAAMTDNVVPSDSATYAETLWYINHEKVKNGSDISQFVNANGLHIYSVNLDLIAGETFSLRNVTANAAISGRHLVSLTGDALDFAVIDGDVVRITKNGSYMIGYSPCCGSITIGALGSGSNNLYMMLDGAFVELQPDAANIVTYENLHREKNDYVTFADGSYNMLAVTLANDVDKTAVRLFTYNDTTMVYFDKAGTFTLHLNAETNVLSVTVVELDPVELTSATLTLKQGSSTRYTMTVNPENSAELCYNGVVITTLDGTYLSISDSSFSTLQDLTLDEGSNDYGMVMMNMLIYPKQTGTYNVYLNKTTHVVRLEKAA